MEENFESLEVTVPETVEALGKGAIALDVRENHEFSSGHIIGAQHIPLGEVFARHQEIDKSKEIHVICAVGVRSLTAASALRSLGYNAVSMSGGMNLWIDAGHPVE